MLDVKTINKPNELNLTEFHSISHLLWGTRSMPATHFRIGFIPGDAFYIEMICEEQNPLRNYTRHRDPVYRDSAMEAFFLFAPSGGDMETYLNFEMNANGALLAAYGPSRMYRSYFTPEEYRLFRAKAWIQDNKWGISFRIPICILEKIYGPLTLEKGSHFFCNFYKISENAETEHYGAYAPIDSPVPSFHMPEYFEEAVLV